MLSTKPRIGIIGGAGPMAGALLFEKIITVCQRYGCEVDADFPFCCLLNYPFTAMLDTKYDRIAIEEQLTNCFNFLTNNGITVAAIACNTLHAFLPPLAPGIKFVHMIEETANYVKSKEWDTPLILCSATATHIHLHASYFPCRYPHADLQKTIDDLIVAITKGCDLKAASQLLSTSCSDKGPVILGCTELSLLHAREPLAVKQLVSSDSLVAETIGRIFFEPRCI